VSRFEQRANIKFCFKLGKTATETLKRSCIVYDDEALKKTAVYDWFIRFHKLSRESLEDEERRRLSIFTNVETVENVKNLVRSDIEHTPNRSMKRSIKHVERFLKE